MWISLHSYIELYISERIADSFKCALDGNVWVYVYMCTSTHTLPIFANQNSHNVANHTLTDTMLTNYSVCLIPFINHKQENSCAVFQYLGSKYKMINQWHTLVKFCSVGTVKSMLIQHMYNYQCIYLYPLQDCTLNGVTSSDGERINTKTPIW